MSSKNNLETAEIKDARRADDAALKQLAAAIAAETEARRVRDEAARSPGWAKEQIDTNRRWQVAMQELIDSYRRRTATEKQVQVALQHEIDRITAEKKQAKEESERAAMAARAVKPRNKYYNNNNNNNNNSGPSHPPPSPPAQPPVQPPVQPPAPLKLAATPPKQHARWTRVMTPKLIRGGTKRKIKKSRRMHTRQRRNRR
jgi:hypothetical protein